MFDHDAGVIDQAQVDAEERPALLAFQREARLLVQLLVLRQQHAGGAHRAHLGHAPGVDHAGAVLLLPRHDHRRRARRAADHHLLHRRQLLALRADVREQRHPHRRARRAGCSPVRVSISSSRLVGSSPGPGQHELRSGHRRRVGHAPRVDVEHRHHRQRDIGGADAERVGHADGVGVNDGRAVRVQHALRESRRARRVAQRRGGVLVEGRPVERLRLAGDQSLVVERVPGCPDRPAGGPRRSARRSGEAGLGWAARNCASLMKVVSKNSATSSAWSTT